MSQFPAIVPPALRRFAESISASLEPCLDLSIDSSRTEAAPLASRLYGNPFLHHLGDWPRNPEGRPLAFIGQIHLDGLDKEALAALPILPGSGLLSLFFDLDAVPAGQSAEDRYRFRLLWTPQPGGGAAIPPPAGTTELGPSCAVTAALRLRIPAEGDASFRLGDLSEVEFREYDALSRRLAAPCEHRLLGPADWLVEDARETCVRATSRLWPGGAWRLLWQVGGDPYLAAALGEEARLYVMIGEEDLRERRFLRSWVVLQRA